MTKERDKRTELHLRVQMGREFAMGEQHATARVHVLGIMNVEAMPMGKPSNTPHMLACRAALLCVASYTMTSAAASTLPYSAAHFRGVMC